MSRPLRIEYPGAWYHVMNRGRRSEKIFHDRHDYQVFVELLEESSEIWNVRVAAYVLMPNHYHILVNTPDANISRCMRHINGVYTQRFNRKHRCDGQLFRGRYKSILVGGDSYLLQLVRYIHRNPARAGIVSKLDDYPWSSHKGYLSVAEKWQWLHKEFVFRMLTKNTKEWVREYQRFMAVESDGERVAVMEDEGKKWPSVIGPERFIHWVKGRYYNTLKVDQEISQTKDLAPETDLIINSVCEFYDIRMDELYRSRRGQFNEPRNVAIFLIRKLSYDTLSEIGCRFQMERYSSISSIIERMKKLMQVDQNLNKRVSRISDEISKSQEQT